MSLSGKVLVLSGFRDESFEQAVALMGAVVRSAVSTKTDIVVFSKKGASGQKVVKANQLGKKVIELQEFKALYMSSRAVASPKAKSCPEGKVRNPATGRCIKDNAIKASIKSPFASREKSIASLPVVSETDLKWFYQTKELKSLYIEDTNLDDVQKVYGKMVQPLTIAMLRTMKFPQTATCLYGQYTFSFYSKDLVNREKLLSTVTLTKWKDGDLSYVEANGNKLQFDASENGGRVYYSPNDEPLYVFLN
jgi:hypothetical protein